MTQFIYLKPAGSQIVVDDVDDDEDCRRSRANCGKGKINECTA